MDPNNTNNPDNQQTHSPESNQPISPEQDTRPYQYPEQPQPIPQSYDPAQPTPPQQQPLSQPQPYAQQSGQSSQQPQIPYPQYPVSIPRPGRIISIIGFIFAFVGLGLPGLVLSIIGLHQSKKGGKADIWSILGVIFNSLAIILGLLYIGLILIGYLGIQSNAADTRRMADASTISSAAEAYKTNGGTGIYPGSDSTTFAKDIAALKSTVSVDGAIVNKIAADHPSKARPDTLHIIYCGGQDASTATGLEVEYWSVAQSKIKVVSTGTGCVSDSTNSSNGIQNGSSSPQTSQSLFN